MVKGLMNSRPEGAIIVTTPQEVALATIRKEIDFCRKMNLNIIGIVENMNGFTCPCCQVFCVYTCVCVCVCVYVCVCNAVHNVLVDDKNVYIIFTFEWTVKNIGLGYPKSDYGILFMHHLA